MYAVVFEMPMAVDQSAADAEAQLDHITNWVSTRPGFVRGTWSSDGSTGLSFQLWEDEASAREHVERVGSGRVFRVARDIT